MMAALLVVHGLIVSAIVLSWAYFRRYAITRPPIGVFNLADIGIMIASIILIPFLYLALPSWLVLGLLILAAVSTLYVVWEPVVRVGWVRWLLVLPLVGADVGLAQRLGMLHAASLAVNNLVMVGMVVGITNLWAQSGMRARDVVVLGVALIVYDYIATSVVGQMGDLYLRLAALPLVPMIAWPLGDGEWISIGLGDMLLAAVFPLVMRKAFGRRMGLLALGLGILAIGVTSLVLFVGRLADIFPLMVVLGPLMLLQYAYWRRQHGPERTTWQYLQAEPLHSPPAPEAYPRIQRTR